MNDHEYENDHYRIPACDSCRARKVKCDREVPCSSCRSWKITCHSTLRPKEKRQRAVPSTRYDHEFRDLNRKLEKLSVTLQSFVDNAKAGDTVSHSLHLQVVDVLASVKQEGDEDEELFQGESSFPAQWRDVTQLYGPELEDQQTHGSNGDQTSMFGSSQIFPSSNGSSSTPGPKAFTSSLPQLTQLPLPPTHHVLNVLRISKVSPQRALIDIPFVKIDRLSSLCQKLYFPTEDYTLSTFITVNSLLGYLFRDMSKTDADKINISKPEQIELTDCCRNNVYTAMRLWNIATEPVYENIEAIVLGSFVLMEGCYIRRTWNSLRFACQLLEDAGYHRQTTFEALPGEDRLQRKWLFWTAYSFDHAISLDFGRPANIQDWDITVEMPDPGLDDRHGQHLIFWIELARLCGKIYERLYSGRAMKLPQIERTKAARDLANEIIGIDLQCKPLYAELDDPDLSKGAETSFKVILYSTLTTIYKCIPPTSSIRGETPRPLQFCDECILAARTALQTMDDAWGRLQDSGSETRRLFVHWCLLGSPFLPFLVIFSNIMNLPNNVHDYQLLVRVGRTVDDAASASNGLAKLNNLCQSVLRLAKRRYEPVLQQTKTIASGASIDSTASRSSNVSLMPDISTFDQTETSFVDWGMLDGWELGPGAEESAREMNSYFERFSEAKAW